MPARILVIDDDENLLKSLRKILRLQDYSVDAIANPTRVAGQLESQAYDCILLDVRMPGVSGLDLLRMILEKCPATPVIMISGQSAIATAVQSLKDGAYDFIEKPIDPERLFVAVKNAVQKKVLQEEKDTIFQELQERFRMIGESPAMKAIFQRIAEVAATSAKVLIMGESGTGKELVAWAIHHNSDRKSKPYVKLNCAAIPSELLESEIFGHRKGSFTGAVSDRKGKFIEAHGGSLFLDEIGDMDLHLQAKLLRVLDNNEVEMIGENFPKKVDVRVIAATNHVLEKMVEAGTFRADLYHRLNVVKIAIPPLRERPEDIQPLAFHFLREFSGIYNKQVLSFTRPASALLMNYPWPGNVRELRNVMEKVVIFSHKKEIGIHDLQSALDITNPFGKTGSGNVEDEIIPLKNANHNFEKEYLLMCLDKCNWKIGDTAAALAIDRSNLFKKMRKHGIRR
ncbi:MAG: sigma-54-dependent transcriptional regulator [bacterium]